MHHDPRPSMDLEREGRKRWLRRACLVVWFVVCTCAALHSSLQMFVTFAPQHAGSNDLARGETQAIERVRRFWAGSVFVTSGLLMTSAAVLLWREWRMPTDRQ